MKQKTAFVGLLVLLLIVGAAPGTAVRASATFAVDTTLDAVDVNPGDGVCEASPSGGGLCTLRAAVQEANVLAGADTITLPAGVYGLSRIGDGEDAAATGDLDILDTLTISGTGVLSTTIDGGGFDRVLEIDPGPVSAGVAVTITGMLIRNGVAPGTSAGGGILNNGKLVLANVAVSDNRARSSAAGIYNFNGGDLMIVDSVISGNIAGSPSESGGNGAGLYNWYASATLTNVTISSNLALGHGGGIYSGSGGGGTASLTLTNVTIAGNAAGQETDVGDGGGIFILDGTVSLKNTLLAGNTDAGKQAPDCAGSLSSAGHNLIQSTAGCAITGTLDGNVMGLDPIIGSLANNGGATLTRALLVGSPALDGADMGGCPATDQRGALRPFDGDGDLTAECDIGAYEAQVVQQLIFLPLIVREGT